MKKVVDSQVNNARLKNIDIQMLVSHELQHVNSEGVSVLFIANRDYCQDGMGKGFVMVAHLLLDCLVKGLAGNVQLIVTLKEIQR